jgi:hypothetical protein
MVSPGSAISTADCIVGVSSGTISVFGSALALNLENGRDNTTRTKKSISTEDNLCNK